MKKLVTILLAVLLVLTLGACSKKADAPAAGGNDAPAADKVKVAVLLPFTGDQSYFDTLAKGVKTIQATMSDTVEIKLIEADPNGTAEQAIWENAYAEVCEDGEYDLVVSGNSTYEGFLADACAKYPDQMFMNFDTSWDIETPANCYAVNYDLAALGYVVGSLSGLTTKTNKVGVVVGMDFQAMNAFIGGYCQVLTDMGVEYAVVYPNSFTDTALGKEYAENLIGLGCDVIWQVAGGLGNGVIEACSNHDDVWCIGVDQDQYGQFAKSNPAWANTILTSAQKNTDNVLVKVVEMLVEGKLSEKMGVAETWNINMGGVGMSDNDFYKANCPEDVQAKVEEVFNGVADGSINVVDVMAMTDYATEWPAVRDANLLNK